MSEPTPAAPDAARPSYRAWKPTRSNSEPRPLLPERPLDVSLDVVRTGFDAAAPRELARSFGLAESEIGALIGQVNLNETVRSAAADRLDALQRLSTLAATVLGDPAIATDWWQSPVRALDGRRPVELLDVEAGRERVVEILHAIEYGHYS